MKKHCFECFFKLYTYYYGNFFVLLHPQTDKNIIDFYFSVLLHEKTSTDINRHEHQDDYATVHPTFIVGSLGTE